MLLSDIQHTIENIARRVRALEVREFTAGGIGPGVVPLPADAVVTEQTYGQDDDPGAATTYSRSDHTHGTPPAVAAPVPADTVVTEQTFGQDDNAGMAVTYSRSDHTHGTPPAPLAGDTVGEGPGIDLNLSGGIEYIGLGGDTILLYDSGGVPVAEYAATSAGLDAALAAATDGDAIVLPACTIANNHVIPAGVVVIGFGESSYLSGTITVGGALFNVKTASDVVLDITSPVSEHSVIHLYSRTGAVYSGWAILKDDTTGNLRINRDSGYAALGYNALMVESSTGFLTAYLPGLVRLSDIETYQRFVITAHRGDINPTDGYPENTLAACLSAARKGAHRVEVDTRLSSDGTWYLMHDATVDRTTNGSGNVSAKTDAQMNALNIDAGYGYRVAHAGLYHPPTLRAVMTALAPYDVTIQIDNKVAASAGALAQYVASQGWAQRVAINAYSQAEAQAIKAVSRWIAVVGTSGWSETDLISMSPGTTEAAILAEVPCQVHIVQDLAGYGVSDEADNTRDAYDTGARGYCTWNLLLALAEWREIDGLDEHLAAADPHPQYELESNLSEDIDDRVAALLQAGDNITLTYNDVGNTLTIASDNDLPYGSYSSSADQTMLDTGVAYAITYTDREGDYKVSLVNNSKIYLAEAGTYLITFSAVGKSSLANKTLDIWMSVDGVNVPRTNTISKFVGAANERVITVTYIYTFTAGQYFELYMHSDDTGTILNATAAQAAPDRPACPSIITTVNKISDAMPSAELLLETGDHVLLETGDKVLTE